MVELMILWLLGLQNLGCMNGSGLSQMRVFCDNYAEKTCLIAKWNIILRKETIYRGELQLNGL